MAYKLFVWLRTTTISNSTMFTAWTMLWEGIWLDCSDLFKRLTIHIFGALSHSFYVPLSIIGAIFTPAKRRLTGPDYLRIEINRVSIYSWKPYCMYFDPGLISVLRLFDLVSLSFRNSEFGIWAWVRKTF